MNNKITSELPEVKAPIRTILMCLNICIGFVNMGYCATYLSLSIFTLYQKFKLTDIDEQRQQLSVLNGVYPLGCAVGVLMSQMVKRRLPLKWCLILSDVKALLSQITLVEDTRAIASFRFFLGMGCGISSYATYIYLKALCPQRYFNKMSIVIGVSYNLGYMIGFLISIGYLGKNGEPSDWWRIVFAVPAIIASVRLFNILFVFNYDSPIQLIRKKKIQEARELFSHIYVDNHLDQVMLSYSASAEKKEDQSVSNLFRSSQKHTLVLTVGTMLMQQWCGAYTIIFFASQIFAILTNADQYDRTMYCVVIGVICFPISIVQIFVIQKMGVKINLMAGAGLIFILDIIILSLSSSTDSSQQTAAYVIILFMMIVFTFTINPVAMAMIYFNDVDGIYFSLQMRSIFQLLMVFLFPYMQKSIEVWGSFLIFAFVSLIYIFFIQVQMFDDKGLELHECKDQYAIKEYVKVNITVTDANNTTVVNQYQHAQVI